MQASMKTAAAVAVAALLLLTTTNCIATRKLASLYQPPPTILTYHHGPLLHGDIPVTLLWYGNFTANQRSILHDLLLSLTPTHPTPSPTPTVAQWWRTVDRYLEKAGAGRPPHAARILLADQLVDPDRSLGRVLTRADISDLASGRAAPKPGGLTVVLTSEDVAVEGFCSSICGFHSSRARPKSAFLWVGNSAVQCPGQCAWPFHEPVYGPAWAALAPPNGDVGVDGMVINLGVLLAGAVTNPYGDGFYDGLSREASVEVGEVCPGVFGKGAYPGFPGEVLVDGRSGGSYNAVGLTGRKYLLPALFDVSTSRCVPLV